MTSNKKFSVTVYKISLYDHLYSVNEVKRSSLKLLCVQIIQINAFSRLFGTLINICRSFYRYTFPRHPGTIRYCGSAWDIEDLMISNFAWFRTTFREGTLYPWPSISFNNSQQIWILRLQKIPNVLHHRYVTKLSPFIKTPWQIYILGTLKHQGSLDIFFKTWF